ncbi:MAG TPA: hypothetical protein PKC65_01720 [Pyrinomonadaceae bacterium]|nr:hypothetical protein [Pyrinomonadaceae bacterium]
MKIAMVIVRTLMGLLFIFASVVVLLDLAPVPELTGVAKTFNDGIFAVGYFIPMLKIVELTCGILFVTGRFVPLATILIAPIIVNIFAYHAFIDNSGLPVAIFLVAANAFVAFYYRVAYRELFRSNPKLAG